MLKLGKKKEEQTVGIDIGSRSIKIASIKHLPGEKVLSAYNIKDLPLKKEDIGVNRYIKEALEEVDLSPSEVNLSIYGPDVIVRFINLPKMTKEQLEGALVFEAEKYIPFNVNEVILDFAILGDAPEAGQMKVLLAAAKRLPIESMIKAMEDVGIMVSSIDINAFAAFNSFVASNPESSDKAVALLEMGHTHTDVVISVNHSPHFMRQIQIGGKDISTSIARNLSVPEEKADQMRVAPKDDEKESVDQITAQVLDDIIQEVQLSFGYFENTCNASIDAIYCSGGLLYSKGVTEYIGKKLGIAVKEWNPISSLNVSENISRQDVDSVASKLSVSVGLAMRD